MARGFVYPATVLDWHSRRVLPWRVSVTIDADCCIEAVDDAITRHGIPEISNSDQGSQFTSQAFTGLLKQHSIAISMEVAGATTSSSSGCGSRSSRRRSVCTPTGRSAMPASHSVATSSSTAAADPTARLIDRRRTRSTSPPLPLPRAARPRWQSTHRTGLSCSNEWGLLFHYVSMVRCVPRYLAAIHPASMIQWTRYSGQLVGAARASMSRTRSPFGWRNSDGASRRNAPRSSWRMRSRTSSNTPGCIDSSVSPIASNNDV